MQRPRGEQEWEAFWELECVHCGQHRVGEVAKDEARDTSRGPLVPCSSKCGAQTRNIGIPQRNLFKIYNFRPNSKFIEYKLTFSVPPGDPDAQLRSSPLSI